MKTIAGRRWTALALAVVAVVTVANAWRMVRASPARPLVASAAAPDPVMRAEARLADVRAALREHGVDGKVGYVGWSAAEERGRLEYFLAQFALAPVVLVPGAPDREWLLVNFPGEDAAAHVPAGYQVIAAGTDGTALARRTVP